MSKPRHYRLRRGLTAAGLAALAATSACTSADRGGTGKAMAGEPRASMAPAPSVIVGGQPMLPSKTIVDNAVNSADHKTLVAAVAAAGLVDTLKGDGPFTVFAPVDSAFAALPSSTVDNLMKPENRATLTSVLTYHVVPGRLDAAALRQRVAAGGGTAELDDGQRRESSDQGQRAEQPRGRGRAGRHRHHLDLQRLSVERRDPRDRRRAAADLSLGGRFLDIGGGRTDWPGPPKEVFGNPRSERLRQFLASHL